ncbi:MAG: hypothetical protein ACOC56_02135 [Atribacterota bacterium]
MKKEKIGIIGLGFVGNALAETFKKKYEIKKYDISPEKSSHNFEETILCDFVFVCLPSPMAFIHGGPCDLSIIDDFFDKAKKILNYKGTQPIFIIKSTIPPGTTEELNIKYNLNIIHNPEFLTAKNAVNDFKNPSRIVLGGIPNVVEPVIDLYTDFFPETDIYTMSSKESEMVKYVANCFLAVKIMFFNEMKLLSDAKNMNWNNILKAVLSDKRINSSHTKVPGDDGLRGFGSFCFPKDINALIHTFKKEGLDAKILNATWSENLELREFKDWATNPSSVSIYNKKK